MDDTALKITLDGDRPYLKCTQCGNDDSLLNLYEVIKDHPIYGKVGQAYCIWCIMDVELKGVEDAPLEDLPLYLFYPFVSDFANAEAANRLNGVKPEDPNNLPDDLKVFINGSRSKEDLKTLLDSYNNRKPSRLYQQSKLYQIIKNILWTRKKN